MSVSNVPSISAAQFLVLEQLYGGCKTISEIWTEIKDCNSIKKPAFYQLAQRMEFLELIRCERMSREKTCYITDLGRGQYCEFWEFCRHVYQSHQNY